MTATLKFVIVMGTGSQRARDRITVFLSQQVGWGWWHQMENLWLVCIPNQPATTAGLRDVLREQAGEEVHLLVLAVDGSYDWAAVGPPGAFDWLTSDWTGDPNRRWRRALGVD